MIPAGTPMVQVIPFKRESWEMSFGDESDIKQQKDIEEENTLRFFDKYKTLFRSPKEYK
jgi:hypothetical protein